MQLDDCWFDATRDLDEDAENMWGRLLNCETLVDDYGNMEVDPDLICATLYKFRRRHTAEQVLDRLRQYEQAGMIRCWRATPNGHEKTFAHVDVPPRHWHRKTAVPPPPWMRRVEGERKRDVRIADPPPLTNLLSEGAVPDGISDARLAALERELRETKAALAAERAAHRPTVAEESAVSTPDDSPDGQAPEGARGAVDAAEVAPAPQAYPPPPAPAAGNSAEKVPRIPIPPAVRDAAEKMLGHTLGPRDQQELRRVCGGGVDGLPPDLLVYAFTRPGVMAKETKTKVAYAIGAARRMLAEGEWTPGGNKAEEAVAPAHYRPFPGNPPLTGSGKPPPTDYEPPYRKPFAVLQQRDEGEARAAACERRTG